MIYWLIIFIVLLIIGTWRILKNAFICLRELIWIWYSNLTVKHFNTLKTFDLIASIWFFKDIIELTAVDFPSVSWGEPSKFRYGRTGILNSKKDRELNKIVFNRIIKIIIKTRHMKSGGARGCYNCICRSRHRLLSKC